MTKRKALEWLNTDGGKYLGWPACGDCSRKMLSPGLIEACASVGIEHGKSTATMLREFLDSYHERGHKETE